MYLPRGVLLSDCTRYETIKHRASFSYMYITCREQSTGNRCVFSEEWYGFKFLSRNRSVALIWDSPNSHVISSEHHDKCCAAAVMASSLVDVCAVWMHLD